MPECNITLQRDESGADYTYGKLYLDDFECETLEDEYREVKVKDETRIPAGRYEIKLRDAGGMHKRYAEDSRLNLFHMGMLHLQSVPNFTYVYIHIGNSDDDTSGCILVGTKRATYRGQPIVANSVKAYSELYRRITDYMMNGDKVFITIKDPEV